MTDYIELAAPVLTFTLDTNCLIAVEDGRPEKRAVQQLAAAHQARQASVGLVAISASERQRDGSTIENFATFQERVKSNGLGELELLAPMMYWDITFWDFSDWSDDPMEDLERRIHAILFPTIEFEWIDYARTHGLDPNSPISDKRWRNAKCDVQAFWSHASRKRDVFVSSDQNFHAATKKSSLLALANGRIEYPETAVALLEPSGNAA